MSVKVRIPTFLHPSLYGPGRSYEIVEVMGHTVGECIDQLEIQFPGIKQELYDEKGQLKAYYCIYINSESSHPEELLAKPVEDGDELIYEWSASDGSINGDGAAVAWSAPETEGTYSIVVRVVDGNGGEATDSMNISVKRRAPRCGV